MSRHRASLSFTLACSAVLLVGGCKSSTHIFEDQNEGGFLKSPNIFNKPDWARPSTEKVSLGPQGPVGAEDLVGADGQCPPPPAATVQAAEPPPAQSAAPADANREVGSVAGPAAPTRTAAGADPSLQKLEPTMPQVAGGIALGMTECQAVQRAGVPANVAISAGDKGERRAVLTFLSGPWPGIYTFADGRLKVIDRAPEQPKPAAPAKKTPKKKSGAPKTASQNLERSYVQ
ncbi:MAG: hypothetical protein WBD15_22885 [Pseudolabrys sp.]